MRKKQEQVKIFVFEKKWWTAAVCLCLAAVMFYVVNYPAAVGASAATRQLPIYCVQRDQKLVAISFDAAWGDAILRQSAQAPDRTCSRPILRYEKGPVSGRALSPPSGSARSLRPGRSHDLIISTITKYKWQ